MLINRGRRFAKASIARLIAVDGDSGAGPGAVQAIAGMVAPIEWVSRTRAPTRTNLLIPTIDLNHFFGGYIAKFNLARRLTEQGHRVRLVTVHPVCALPPSWREEIEAYDRLSGIFSTVEVAFGREAGRIEANPADQFIATTWSTAHIAAHAVRQLGQERFGYLIQEYEPFTVPMGSLAALAAQSYTAPHVALFSTELLREYFRRHQIGVFASGAGDKAALSFQNAITAVEPPTAAELAHRSARRLLFYARPEQHAARNMFELGVLALTRAWQAGALTGWQLYGIGTVGRRRTLSLGGGAKLHLLPRVGQWSYAEHLRHYDVGLALMYTPHPSLVPIEMAAAGMLTVTNTFENKTAAAMAAISPNLLAVRPTIDGIARGIAEAVRLVESSDGTHRLRGSKVAWSRDWDEALPDPLLATFTKLLDRHQIEDVTQNVQIRLQAAAGPSE